MTVILDASALLSVLLREKGAEVVLPAMRRALMSALNASECLSRAVDNGHPSQSVMLLLRQFEIDVVPFDLRQAEAAADLRVTTRHLGASLGDRACLALAKTSSLPILTGDRRLAELDIGIDIRLIR